MIEIKVEENCASFHMEGDGATLGREAKTILAAIYTHLGRDDDFLECVRIHLPDIKYCRRVPAETTSNGKAVS